MPVHYRYDETSRRLFTQCHGMVTLEEVIAHFRELITLTRLKPGSDVLLDFTFMAELPPTQKIDSAARALEEVSEFLRFGRCALVAPEGIAKEAGRRFQSVSWPLFGGMRIFAASAEAAAWLDQQERRAE
jgi:hypothetical protein